MKLFSGTGHQNCSTIKMETDELICLCCTHSTAEDMERRQGHTLVNCPAASDGVWISWLLILTGLFSSVIFTQWKVFLSRDLCPINITVLTKLRWGKALLQRQGWSPKKRVRREGVEVTLAGGSQDPWEQQWAATEPSSQPAEVVGALFKSAVMQTWVSLSKEREPTA